MKLDLYFESPMQSWGSEEYWYKTRRTEASPTKTAIVGMIGRCMGVSWENADKLDEIAKSFEIVDSEATDIPIPTRMTDDQTIYIGDYVEAGIANSFKTGSNKPKRTNSGLTVSQQLTKDYLEDEKIIITIEGSREDLEHIRQAISHPFWPPYLGRACCIPSGPIIRGEVY